MMVRVFGHYIPRAILALVFIEFVVLIVAHYLGVSIYFGWQDAEEFYPLLPKSLLYAFVTCAAMTSMGLYSRGFRDGNWGIVVRVFASMAASMLVLVLLFYLIPDLFIGRIVLGWALMISAVAIIAIRLVFSNFFDFERMKSRILIIGTENRAAAISTLLRRKEDQRGIAIVGYVQLSHERPVVEAQVIQHDRPLRDLARERRIDVLVMAVDDRRNAFPVQELVECRMLGLEVQDLTNFIERHSRKILLGSLHPSWLIFSEGFRYGMIRDVEKRVFDISASLLLLLFTWPLMLLTLIAILIESGGRGPVFYRQKRVGEHGDLFDVLKFRSMTVDAEADGSPQWASKNDARVTRTGRIIRKFRVDELPQLFNVLRGEMSFVGPRPERPEFVEQLSKKIPYYQERHRVKPGITGWAQICYPYGASEQDAEGKLEYDLYYVKNYSMFLDLIILLQTAQTVLWGRGAR